MEPALIVYNPYWTALCMAICRIYELKNKLLVSTGLSRCRILSSDIAGYYFY
jgi:hypothetical protein